MPNNQTSAAALMAAHSDTVTEPNFPEKILSTAKICELIGCNRTSLWRMCRDGRFPKPLHIMNNKRGWLRSDYDEWLEKLVARREVK